MSQDEDTFTIGCRIGRTVNTGNFESYRVDEWATSVVSKDSWEEELNNLKFELGRRVKHHVDLVHEQVKKLRG